MGILKGFHVLSISAFRNFTAFLILLLFSTTTYSQYCTSAGPYSEFDSYISEVLLTGQASNISYTGACPDNTGLNDLTSSTSVSLTAGTTYTITVGFATCGSNAFPNITQGWIDWNNDSIFQFSETIFQWSGLAEDTVSFGFTVPDYICTLNTRMRLVMDENGTLPTNPCADYSYGSAIDFSVTLTGGNCLIPGCMDPAANNYDPNAEVNNNTCKYGVQQDCEGTLIICNDYSEPTGFTGSGDISNELPSTSCLGEGEKNSAWYRFTAYKEGTLGFTVFPVDSINDYDWAVYDITDNGCSGIVTGSSPEIACNFSPNNCSPPFGDGSTGPNGNTFGPCSGQNSERLDVDSGRQYAILISQFEDLNTNGFRIVFDSGPTSVVYSSSVQVQDYMICSGDSVNLEIKDFTGPDLGSLEFTWYATDSSWISMEESPVTPALENSQDMVLSLKNKDCVIRDTLTIDVGFVSAGFEMIPEYDGFPAVVNFADSSASADNLIWQYGDSTLSDFTIPGVTLEHVYESAGYYWVSQIAENEAFQCFDTVTKRLEIPFILPNIFTPNGDNVNDVLEFKGLKRNSTVEIYSRTGKLITQWILENNDNDEPFDGANVANGMYYYVITEPGANPKQYKGWVYLSR